MCFLLLTSSACSYLRRDVINDFTLFLFCLKARSYSQWAQLSKPNLTQMID